MLPNNQKQQDTNGAGAPGPQVVNIGGVMINQEEMKQQGIDHMKNKVLVVDDVDRQVWELMTNVPRVKKEVAYVCAVLNVVIPGLGTLVAACSANDNVSKTQLGIALVQFLTTFFLVGFVFAAYWSYLLVNKALEDENSVQRFAGDGAQVGSNPRGYQQFDQQ